MPVRKRPPLWRPLLRGEPAGPAVTVNAGLMQAFNDNMVSINSGAGQYSVSNSGTLVFASGGIFPEQVSDLCWVERSGRAEKWMAVGRRPVGRARRVAGGRPGTAAERWSN